MLTTSHHLWDFTDKKRLFWLLQSVGWCAMMLVALGISRSKGGDLAPFILFRSVFGFLVTAFLLRPILRRLWKRYAATPLQLVPPLIGSVLLFGSAAPPPSAPAASLRRVDVPSTSVDRKIDFSYVTITAVPEPSTLALLGLGTMGLALRRRR